MGIGKINFSIPTFNPQKENKNKPLANLNEPIKDTFSFSKKKSSPIDIAANEVAQMKDADGNKRFSEAEVTDFKLAMSVKCIDVDTINTFKDNTNFNMNDMKVVYAMRRDLKDDKFYDKVNDAIAKMPNQKPDHFEQNKFEPNKEFSLQVSKKDMNKLDEAVNKNFPLGYSYKFDAKTGDVIAKTSRDTDFDKVDGKDEFTMKSTTKDLKNNTVTTNKSYYDRDESDFVLVEQKVIKNDKNGKMLREEVTTPSEIKGAFDVKYTYANGKTKQIAKATVDKKTGIQTIKKDMKSENGTRTQFLYEDDPQGNRIVDYKITDKNGKILMSNSQSFEVVDKNHFISSKNGYKYDITTDDENLTVKDLHHNTETSINFKKKCKGNKEELINLLKKVPGEELFETVDSIKKMTGKKNSLESYFNPVTKNINIGDDLFVFLHELGHAKDAQNQKGIFNKLVGDGRIYTNNKDIQKTFFKERETFNKYHSDNEREHVSYFTQAKGHYQGELGGLAEVVAETNAVTNTFTDGKVSCLGPRAQYLQQHFPETIAKIRDAMNWKDDLDAIEYYGT